MNGKFSKWLFDPLDTRDWDIVENQKRIVHKRTSEILSRIHENIKGLKDPRRSQSDVSCELFDSFGGDENYPAASAVLGVVETFEPNFRLRKLSPQHLEENSKALYGGGSCDAGIRGVLKTLKRIGPQTEVLYFGKPSPIGVPTAFQQDFANTCYFRLDRPIEICSRMNRNLYNNVYGCLQANLPVLLSVTLFSDVLNWTIENNLGQFPPIRECSYPIGQHPVLAFESVCPFETEVNPQCEDAFLKKCGKPKRARSMVADSKAGIRVRHYLGSTIGSGNCAVIPEWYFHLGLVRDCWVIINPEWDLGY